MQAAGFRPRRLGHANLFVGELEKSVEFYSRVAGIELVRREPAIQAAFHSNGNTHHDIGMIQCSGGERRGVDGYVQPSSFRGHRPGLNHLGWEVNSEADLIKAIERAEAAGVRIMSYANHQLSHSVYLTDPDGNYHEFYADVVEDWREIFNLEREELVSEQWDWKAARPGKAAHHPPADERRVPGALFHPRRISHATMVVRDLDASLGYFHAIAGLTVAERNGAAALLRAAESAMDLVLIAARDRLQPGLHGLSFLMNDVSSLQEAERTAAARGVVLAATHDGDAKRSAILKDPDGLVVEFFVPRVETLPLPNAARAQSDALWYFAA
jgi:catechol 2,3-dioxygenase